MWNETKKEPFAEDGKAAAVLLKVRSSLHFTSWYLSSSAPKILIRLKKWLQNFLSGVRRRISVENCVPEYPVHEILINPLNPRAQFVPPFLKCKNSAFCPQTVLTCFFMDIGANRLFPYSGTPKLRDNFRLTRFFLKKVKNGITFLKRVQNFSFLGWNRNEKKVAEGYCGAITRAAGLSCCGRWALRVLEFGYQLQFLVYTCSMWQLILLMIRCHLRNIRLASDFVKCK